MPGDISPPPTKRRRLAPPTGDASNPTQAPPPTTTAISDTLRIYSWNINGIAPFLQSQKPIASFFERDASPSNPTSTSKPTPASLRAFLRRHAWPSILLLQEVKIARSDTHTCAAVRASLNARLDTSDTGPAYTAHFTLPRDAHNARAFGGRLYGVCSIIRSDLCASAVTRVREVDWDVEGRVSVIEMEVRSQRLAVWNVYAVNGTEAAYRSPETGQVVGTRHERKRAFHAQLLGECRRLEDEGWRLVLAGDFNVAPERADGWPNLREWPEAHVVNRRDFNEKFLNRENKEGLGAVDAWRWMRGDERKYTYFPRGREWGSSCDRVDLVLVSRELVEQGELVDVGISDSPMERGSSDHVPIFVEVRVGERGTGLHVDRKKVADEVDGSHHMSAGQASME